MNAQTGHAFALARWFQAPEDASGKESDEARERILGEVYGASLIGINAKTGEVIAHTPSGCCIMKEQEGLVVFDFVEDARWARTRFWMNASSVRDLGEQLRKLPRGDFEEMLINFTAKEEA